MSMMTGVGKERARPRRGLGLAAGAFALALAACLAACASVEPPAAPIQTPPPRPEPVTAPVNPERAKLIEAFGGEYSAPATAAYLNGVLARLAPASETPGEPYRVTLLDSPIVNAFALPSGDIFVTRGLLALANDGAEVAAVMAHEIAHVTARHAAQRAELERTAALFQRVSTQVLGKPQEGEEVEARMKLSIAHFSRQQEFEADRIGIKVIAKAGFDPFAASRFLESLGRWSALRASLIGLGVSDKPDMMATHPSTPERIAEAAAQARQFGAPGVGATERDAYLNAIDGISFGDNPAQGLASGRQFVHPKFGFAFTAPEGFALENQRAALIGVGEGGAQALRLDSIDAADGTAPEAALGSGWIDGVQTDSIETLKDADPPVAVAVAKGQQWSFRLAAIKLDRRIFRLIFAAHDLSPAVDARFLAAVRSFHRLTAAESAQARPLRLSIIVAGGSDDPDTLAQRMLVASRPLDQFLILNGLEHGAATPAGGRFKIVTP